MPHAGAIRAGRDFSALLADDSRLARGLKRAEKRMRAFGGSIRDFGLELAGAASEFAVNRWNATQLITQLQGDGY